MSNVSDFRKESNPTIPMTHRPISRPTKTYHIALYDKLTKLGIPIIKSSTQTIKILPNISKRTNNETTSHAGIYYISYKDCNRHYISETQRHLEKKNL